MSSTPSPSNPVAARTVRCPACGGGARYAADNPYRPFCSARCKGVDFVAWADEHYRVAAAPDLGEDADEPPVR